MDLAIGSNTAFNGKKEVMYGLKNMAKAAKEAETKRSLSYGPHPIDTSYDVMENTAKMKAYADMAVYDEAFEATIKEMPKNNGLKNLLAKVQLQYSAAEPFQLFKDTIMQTLRKQHKKPDKDTLNDFFKKISM